MPAHDPPNPEELLYRRISLKNNPPLIQPGDPAVTQAAFLPHKERDTDGLTIVRAAYRAAAEVACPSTTISPNHPGYMLAVVRARDLINLGLTLDVTPDEIDRKRGGTPAHVSIREMNARTYRDDPAKVFDWARRIAEHHVLELMGPYPEVAT